MDKLKLDIRSMDDLHADLKDLGDNLGRLSLLPPGWSGRSKIVSWLEVLGTMQVLKKCFSNRSRIYVIYCLQASDELDEVQARQLSFDLESAYNDFNKILHSS